MARVGFLGRIMLILMVALVALMGLTIGINHLEHRSFAKLAPSYPRIVSAAGIIALVRAAPSERQRDILRAANNRFMRVRLMEKRPTPADGDVRAPHSEARLREMIGVSPGDLEAYTTQDEIYADPTRRGVDGLLMRVDISIPDGRTLVIEWMATSKLAALKILGLAPGVWTGILGFGVAALALFTVFREMRPLRRLTASVSSFDGGRIEPPFAAKGAPDIRRLIEAVHRMQERVATLLRERSFLIGAISHDLRTYLTRLRLRSEDVESEELRERIAADLDSMTRLIETSLAFARGTTTSQTRSRIDLGDLVAVEVEEHNALGLPLALEGTYANGAMVVGDPVALRRVVANILDNALRFARASVKVRVERTAAQERITIEDDGPGIPDDKRSAVFSPFYRVDHARSRSNGGTGLGLAIARQIVEAHGGTIEVSAAATRGAAFVIALPSCPR